MKWVRVASGLWFMWPPRQISTNEPGGPNIWRNNFRNSRCYVPDRPANSLSSEVNPPDYGTPREPVRWFGDHPASWGGYPDGRTMVALRDFVIAYPPAIVRFRLATSNPVRELGFYYASHIENPPTEPTSTWASSGFGPLSPQNAKERLWYYPTPDGRRWVGSFDIEPDGLTFNRSNKLPPPCLPTDREIDAEDAEIQDDVKAHGRAAEWPLLRMTRDLGGSKELMELVGDDSFAAQFQLFFRDNDFVNLESGKQVHITSDDCGTWVLSDLRRYREPCQACEMYPKEESSEIREQLLRLFAEAGYAPCEVAIDQVAHQAMLHTIWDTMPKKLQQAILGEQEKINVPTLAWAMGEFWSESNGWTLPGPDNWPEEISLRGGHFADAIEIAQLMNEGQLLARGH